jgi:hypothetical protein
MFSDFYRGNRRRLSMNPACRHVILIRRFDALGAVTRKSHAELGGNGSAFRRHKQTKIEWLPNNQIAT